MSFENFCREYPEVPELKAQIITQRLAQGRMDISPMSFLARELAKKGGEGLRELTDRLDYSGQRGMLTGPDPDISSRLSKLEKNILFDNHAAVILGISIGELEQALMNREFDGASWVERRNDYVRGSLLPPIEIEGEVRESLSKDQLEGMYSVAEADRTLTLFFSSRRDALPAQLLKLLEFTVSFDHFQEVTLPAYTARAKILLS